MELNRWILLVLIGILDMESNASFSLLSSFFPKVAFGKGVNEFWVGFIFSTFQLARFILFLALGSSIQRIGLKKSFLSGIILVAISTCAFSFVHLIPHQHTRLFIASCLLVRALQGLGCCLYLLSAFVITSKTFKNDIGIAFGFIETCEGLGALGGHALGGWLYMKGGFKLPFLTLTLVITSTLAVAGPFLKTIPVGRENPVQTIESQNEATNGGGLGVQLLKNSGIIFTSIIVFSGSLSVSYMVAFVSLYLDQLSLTPSRIGLIVMALSSSYTFFSLCIGALTNRLDQYSRMAIMLVATLLMSSIYFLTGPFWFNHFDKSQIRWAILFSFMGFAYASQLIPAIAEFFSLTTKIYGVSDEDTKYKSVASGLYNSVLSLGSLIGPILGGTMIQSMGLGDSALVVAGINVIVTFLFLAYYLYQNCKPTLDCGDDGENLLANF